jgi:hypothetical protein
MKRPATKMMVSCALLATLVAAETAYAQTPYGRESPEVYRDGAPATANDSWKSGVAGKRVPGRRHRGRTCGRARS